MSYHNGGGGMHNKRPYDSAPYQSAGGGYPMGGGGGADMKRSRPEYHGNSAGIYGKSRVFCVGKRRRDQK